ncbi:DegT/DnrJ/EryC1/StrS family aminotransferase [Nocardioides sp. YIM 152315]|uniref:DegT/DnrJ/EryC1/StrS family aminotransferase n=1 Tax=Nocardioides sp. YIM 152315 TaxID=3031760 RepID=UPI0023DBC597|nr:DegT/DnrJ/EryC1/StrS family aminotransferase [Nocardioides sp. YIM 152315]MDF1604300.1 DegT/DnrJ/EryC1/StrS family aminotransferase [Nocardioides sp. YIM 152315]
MSSLVQVPVNDLSRAIAAHRREIDSAIADVLDSGWVVLGPQVSGLETELAAHLGVSEAVSVANGTDALTIALTALGCSPGDRVATVANAGGYSTTAIRNVGAVPVYVDVDPDTALMTPSTLAPALDLDVDVVVVTHLFGAMAEIGELVDLCHARGVKVLEDCAQAIGAERGGRRAGSFGDAAAFSFYPTKNLGALGDGGAVCSNDIELAEAVRSLRQYGWQGKYRISRPHGRNSRLDEMQAAILRRRLPFLAAANERRRGIHRRYAEAMRTGRVFGSHDPSFVAHLAVLDLDDREAARADFEAAGIGTDVHYPVPDHLHTVEAGYLVADTLEVTERLADRILTVPCFAELDDEEVDRVCEVLASW